MGLLGGLGQPGKKAIRAKPRQGVGASVRVPGRSIAPRRVVPRKAAPRRKVKPSKGIALGSAQVGGGKQAARRIIASNILANFQKHGLAGLPSGDWKAGDPVGDILGKGLGTAGKYVTSPGYRLQLLGKTIPGPAGEKVTGLGRTISSVEPKAKKNILQGAEGKGPIPDEVHKLAEGIGKNSRIVSTGSGPTIPLATSSGVKPIGAGVQSVKAPQVIQNTVKDAVELASQAVPSVVIPAEAGVEALQGKPQHLQKLVSSFQQTDPFYALATGQPGEALKRAEQHPLYTALEARGGKVLVGRTLGAGGRALGIKAASTERAPAHLYGSLKAGPLEPRSYSKDILAKAGQVAVERARKKAGKDASTITGPKQTRLIRKRAAEMGGVSEAVRRVERAKAGQDTAKSLPPVTRARAVGRAAGSKVPILKKATGTPNVQSYSQRAASTFIAEGYIRHPHTVEADLLKYKALLEKEGKRLVDSGQSLAKREANQHTRSVVDKLLADKQFLAHPEPAFKVRESYVPAENAAQAERRRVGLAAPHEEDAKYVPYAVLHEGARFAEKRSPVLAPGKAYDPMATVKSIKRGLGKDVAQGQLPQIAKREGTGSQILGKTREEGPGYVDKQGKPIHLADVGKRMKAQGIDVAFVPHRPRFKGKSNYYIPEQRYGTRLTTEAKRRKGESAAAGLHEVDPEVLIEQRIRSQGEISSVKHFDHGIRELGVKPGTSWGTTRAQTQAMIDELQRVHPDMPEMVPVKVVSERVSKSQADIVRNLVADTATVDQTTAEHLSGVFQSRFEEGGPPGKWAMMPREAKQVLSDQIQGANSWDRMARAASQAFKKTVLPTSPKWLFGNFVDVNMRTLLHGVVPYADPRTLRAKAALKEYEKVAGPEAATRLQEQLIPGSMYSTTRNKSIHASAEDVVRHGDNLQRQLLRGAWRSHPVRAIRSLWQHYTGGIYGLNSLIEKTPQWAVLGKLVGQEVSRHFNSWEGALKLGGPAMEDFAKGLLQSENQLALARQMEDVFGKWQGYSPGARNFISNYAPFGMWARNSLKFVFVTLPVHHPIKTAILAALTEMTDKERKDLGLSFFAKNAKPNFLQGSIPLGGQILRVQGYTSFGTVSGGTESLANFILPQWGSVLDTLQGKDFTGKDLKNADGTKVTDPTELGPYAVYMGLESMLPLLALVRRLREQGGKTVFGSTAVSPKTKPGSQKGFLQGLRKWADPLQPISGASTTTKKKGDLLSGSGGQKDLLPENKSGTKDLLP